MRCQHQLCDQTADVFITDSDGSKSCFCEKHAFERGWLTSGKACPTQFPRFEDVTVRNLSKGQLESLPTWKLCVVDQFSTARKQLESCGFLFVEISGEICVVFANVVSANGLHMAWFIYGETLPVFVANKDVVEALLKQDSGEVN